MALGWRKFEKIHSFHIQGKTNHLDFEKNHDNNYHLGKLTTVPQNYLASGDWKIPENNLFKNVSKWPTFCDKRKFKRLNMALMIRIRRNTFNQYFIHLHPLIWIFKQLWCPKCFWQNFCQKKLLSYNHSYRKYALENHVLLDIRCFITQKSFAIWWNYKGSLKYHFPVQ